MQTLFEDASAGLAPCRLRHDLFWPPISCAQVREALALAATISDQRLEVALQSAIITLEHDLAGARFLWRRAGYSVLEQVPSAMDGTLSEVVRQYRQALFDATRLLLDEQLQIMEQPHG